MTEYNLLKQVVLFKNLPEDALEEVWNCLEKRALASQEVLFNQGDPGTDLIIVESGRISIFAPPNPGDKVNPIRIFRGGDTLGEMALIDRKPRSVSARAEEPSVIRTLSGTNFQNLIQQHPEFAVSVMAGLSERIRYTTDFTNEVRLWVQRMSEGNYSIAEVQQSRQYEDSNLAALAAEFAQMARNVQDREETLRKEVVQLRIEIDEAKRKREAENIMKTDYYQDLKSKVKQLRQQKQESQD